MEVVDLLQLANSKKEIGAGNTKARNNTGPLMYDLFVLTKVHLCCIKTKKKVLFTQPLKFNFFVPTY